MPTRLVRALRRQMGALLTTVCPAATFAADRNPLDISLREYLAVLVVSLLGGFVSWYTNLKRGGARAAGLVTFIGESFTSVLSGLLTFWLATLADAPKLLLISLVALAGHMGARAIAVLEAVAERRMRGLVETKPGDLTP